MPIRSCWGQCISLRPPLFSLFLPSISPNPSPTPARIAVATLPWVPMRADGKPPGGFHSVSLPNLASVPLIIKTNVYTLHLSFSLLPLSLFQPVCALPRFPAPISWGVQAMLTHSRMWYLIDAKSKRPGRLASQIGSILQGRSLIRPMTHPTIPIPRPPPHPHRCQAQDLPSPLPSTAAPSHA